tara:strand:- start:952 stop:2016 length:1065 start_codon:yes stop_codon:yes gene_type:complete
MKTKRKTKSRDEYRPQVTSKNRPLTSNRIVDVTHKFPNMSNYEFEHSAEPKSVKNYTFNNMNEFIDELVIDSYGGDYDWFNKVSYHSGRGKYGKFETTLDVDSRKKVLKHINQGYTSPKIWEYYLNTKKEVTASPEFVEKMGSIGIDCRRKRQRDLSGTIINIDKYMGGEECMESMKRQNSQRCIRFFIDYSQSSGEDSMRLTKKVILAISICEKIEELGFATEIYLGEVSRPCLTKRTKFDNMHSKDFIDAYRTRPIHCWKMLAKPSGVKIDETYLCNYSITGIFRDLYFDWCRNCLGTDSTIGTPMYHLLNPTKNEDFYKKITDSDIYIGHNSEFSTIITNVVGVVNEGADV